MSLQIEGRNPVLEALRSGRVVREIIVARRESGGPIGEILRQAESRQISVREVGAEQVRHRAHSANAQGVIAYLDPIPFIDVDDIVERAWAQGEDPFVVVAAGLQDPHNLGALLRTADAAGCHGVVIPRDRAVGLTATVVKASAGAALYVPIARVTNLVRAVGQLKTAGLWVFGAVVEAETSIWEAPVEGPVAVVVGAEGTGIPRLLREKCDFTVSIPMRGKLQSLNASVAAALLLFEVVRRRRET